MQFWAYRATSSGADLAGTTALLERSQFLWRPLFKNTSQRSKEGLPPTHGLLRRIAPGDVVFVYYGRDLLGGYIISPRRARAHVECAPAMVRVEPDDPLSQELSQFYEPDPFVGQHLGFDLSPLREGVEPPGEPRFSAQYAVGDFRPRIGTPDASARRSSSDLAVVANVLAPTHDRCWGVDWSGAAVAGDKIWVSELDAVTRGVVRVTCPWPGMKAASVIQEVATWVGSLGRGWVAFDFPFGVAECDLVELLGPGLFEPLAWGRELGERYPGVDDFIGSVTERGLVGKHRRGTDKQSPFAPLLLQMIRQTYWGERMLPLLQPEVGIVPWSRPGAVTVVETCPAVFLKRHGISNVGYKLVAGSRECRGDILNSILAKKGWSCPETVRIAVEDDREGDALDAVLAGIAAFDASAQDHSLVALLPGALEGHIY